MKVSCGFSVGILQNTAVTALDGGNLAQPNIPKRTVRGAQLRGARLPPSTVALSRAVFKRDRRIPLGHKL